MPLTAIKKQPNDMIPYKNPWGVPNAMLDCILEYAIHRTTTITADNPGNDVFNATWD